MAVGRLCPEPCWAVAVLDPVAILPKPRAELACGREPGKKGQVHGRFLL